MSDSYVGEKENPTVEVEVEHLGSEPMTIELEPGEAHQIGHGTIRVEVKALEDVC